MPAKHLNALRTISHHIYVKSKDVIYNSFVVSSFNCSLLFGISVENIIITSWKIVRLLTVRDSWQLWIIYPNIFALFEQDSFADKRVKISIILGAFKTFKGWMLTVSYWWFTYKNRLLMTSINTLEKPNDTTNYDIRASSSHKVRFQIMEYLCKKI